MSGLSHALVPTQESNRCGRLLLLPVIQKVYFWVRKSQEKLDTQVRTPSNGTRTQKQQNKRAKIRIRGNLPPSKSRILMQLKFTLQNLTALSSANAVIFALVFCYFALLFCYFFSVVRPVE